MPPPALRSVLVAGGGTAGHVQPALAIADALRAAVPGVRLTLLGTASGLEARLVPARGYPLETIPRVPLPRRLTPQLVTVPVRLAAAARATGRVLERTEAQVVVGVGGYVCVPAYLEARRRHLGLVVHEQNARPGVANRIGALLTHHVGVTFPGTPLRHGVLTGMPLRPEITGLDRRAQRPAARDALGLPREDAPTLLVTGGSQGARRLNQAVVAAAPALLAAGVQVLHVTGAAQLDGVHADLARVLGAAPADACLHPGSPYRLLGYVERMAQAYAASDLALCRAGAMTCTELAAVGLPAIFVPLPIGNGEQRLNAAPTVAAGGGVLVEDGALTGELVRATVLELLGDPDRLEAMGGAARAAAPPDAAAALVAMVLDAAAGAG